MAENTGHFYCAFDICSKKLKEFCSLCEENGKYYCDDICIQRDMEECTPSEVITWH